MGKYAIPDFFDLATGMDLDYWTELYSAIR